jgi:cobaltochelatase CobT
MAQSAWALGLKIRFSRPAARAELDAYRAFTTVYDQVVDAEELDSVLGPPKAKVLKSYEEAVAAFRSLFNGERVEIAASGSALVRNLKQKLSATDRAQTIVSLLIDYSGSMRGIRMMSALLAVEGAIDALKHAGIAFEVLGFTTSSWKGGKSRRAWRWAGRPANPGRLCDLLHIVYHSADRGSVSHPKLAPALHPDLLHENIDGEALAWAASRLDASQWPRRVI